MLIDLAEFYGVDIREIIGGARESACADTDSHDTLKSFAEYTMEKEKTARSNTAYIACGVVMILLVSTFLFSNGTAGLLYGILPEVLCNSIMVSVYGLAFCLLVSYLRACLWQEKTAKELQKSVAATVVSKEIKPGTHGAGRSKGGFSYVVTFRTEDEQMLELFAHELEFGGLKEGMSGILTYKGRYFVAFQ